MTNLYQKIRLRTLFEKTDIKIPIELGFESSDIENIDKGLDLYYLNSKISNLNIGIIHSPFDGLNIATINTKIRDYSLKMIIGSIEIAKVFKVKKIIFHTGIKDSKIITEEEYKNLIESISIIKNTGAKAGVLTLLENTYENVDFFRKIKDETDIKFCIDVGHIECFAKESIDKWLSVMDKRIEHIHLHDNDGTADLHLPLGKGKINFEKIINYMFLNNIEATFESGFDFFEENKSFIEKFYNQILK